jgi:hypothetical protein
VRNTSTQHVVDYGGTRLVSVVLEEINHVPAGGVVLVVAEDRHPAARSREGDAEHISDHGFRHQYEPVGQTIP